MKTYRNLYGQLCSFQNIFLSFINARKGKTQKPYIIEFEKELSKNLFTIQKDLINETYKPKPLEVFILRDPKTRRISKSHFSDRIVHHAVYNIIQPFLEKMFIYDSYANRVNKGTLAAIKRFEYFKRKVSHNYTQLKDKKNIKGYVLKADVRKFFDSVNHDILLKILSRKIADTKVMKLIKIILDNHESPIPGKGMPLGNLTSQFFANVYLNELDQYVKHTLKAKYYIRYVDDFVILDNSKEKLEFYKGEIDKYLRKELDVQLHPDKSRIFSLYRGTPFLGARIYTHHRLLIPRNIRKFRKKLTRICKKYDNHTIEFDDVYDCIEGWVAHSMQTSSHNLRKKILRPLDKYFDTGISTKEYNRYIKRMKELGML
jgi:retron-type reverse transcriptase